MRFDFPLLTGRVAAVLSGALFTLLLVVPFGQVSSLRNALACVVLVATVWAVRSVWRELPLLLPFVIWIGWCALSAVWSPSPYYSLKATYLDWILGVGVFYGAMLLARSPGQYCRLVFAATAALVLLAALSVALALLAPSGAEVAHELRAGVFRYYPGVGVASTCAAFLLPLVLVWLGRPSASKLAWLTFFVAAALVVGVVAKNRMFWLVMIAAICCAATYVWSNYAGRGRRWSLLAWAALAVAVGVLFLNTVEDRSSPTATVDASVIQKSFTDDSRLKAWGYWLGKAAESPLRGYGYDKRQLSRVHTPEGRAFLMTIGEALLTHAHNLVLDIALRTGLIGLALFAWVIYSLTLMFWRRRNDADPEIRFAALAGLILILVMFGKNFTDDFFENPMILVFWSTAGLLMGRLLRPADMQPVDQATVPAAVSA